VVNGQVVHFARVLAQIWERPDGSNRYLLLDEPTAFLDINHQHQFLRTAKRIASEGTVVIAVVHDINLAAQYGDQIIALHRGRKITQGKASEVLTPSLFMTMYGMQARVFRPAEAGHPLIVF
jgi:iron complex transport system ATP-binding protein